MTWQDKINKINQQDCLELMKEMPDGCVDLCVTDPPYGIDYQSNMRIQSKQFEKLENDDNDMRFVAFKEIYRVLKNDSVIVSFCSFKNYAVDYLELEKYFNIKNCIIWFKGGGGIGDLEHSLSTDYEMAIVGHKGLCPIRGKRDGSVWEAQKVFSGAMTHPTEKPIDIMGRIIGKFSDVGNLVFDPFMGSWTTARACMEMERNFIGAELSADYCEIGKQRLRQQVLL